MDFWTLRQITEFIGIEKAFEEFREADPDLNRLESTRPDRRSKKHKEWYTQYCLAHDDATERFVELFREKILVAWALRDDKEDDDGIALPPDYWTESIVSLTIDKGRVEGLLLKDRHKKWANGRAVLRREDWKKWIIDATPDSQHESQGPAESPVPGESKDKPKRKRDVGADHLREIKIRAVLAKARREWPNGKKFPGVKPAARELVRKHRDKLNYKFATVCKILDGTYPASRRLGISGI